MDVEALVEAPFVKNGENGHVEPPSRERVVTSSKSHYRSPTPSSEHSRHSSRRRDQDRYRDRDERDSSRHRRDDRHRSHSRSRHRDDRYDDRDRHDRRRSDDRYRDRDDRYRDDRSDRRRSRYDDEYDNDRSRKRRREYDDRERSRSRPVDDRDPPKSQREEEPPRSARDPSPVLTEEERDLRTVFVQQLAARLRTKELIKFFEQAGPVREAQIVKDRISGRSKGVGYVEFRNPGSVSEAISMTGQRLLGIPVIVQITEAEKNRQARLEAAAVHAGIYKEAPPHRLYIGNIHFNLTEDDIKAVFAPFGEIEQVQLQKEHDTGRSRGYGFVQYCDPPSAREALERLNGFELAGRAIRVGLGNDKFTNESTQAILDRYNGFRDGVSDTPRGGAERSVGGAGGAGVGRGSGTLDDADDSGVSLQNVSREALMRKLARDEPKEEAPPARKAPQITAPTASRCVLLKDMFDPAEETGTTWVKELEDDVKAECESKYGKVTHIHVEENSAGEIYIKFDSVSGGEKAIQGLNGRWFGGRSISAAPISDAQYAAKFPRARAL